jgi:NAD+ synthase
VRYDIVPIEEPVTGFNAALQPLFKGHAPDITEENLQSRARGTVLMAISNKFGPMVVTTGNKSEVSVGYATLYGDMNGGFNPIKDLYKTEVYRLAAWRNENRPKGCLGRKAW